MYIYPPPFISQILDFICRMVLIFILIYFEWRDTENQQFWFAIEKNYQGYPQANGCPCSVSAARGKRLPMDTTENFTKLMNYSGLQKQKLTRVKSQANDSAAQSRLLPKDITENVTTLIYSGL